MKVVGWSRQSILKTRYPSTRCLSRPRGNTNTNQRLLENRWLILYSKLGPSRGLISLMVVVQKNKGKVHPLLDYRELNGHVCIHCSCRCFRGKIENDGGKGPMSLCLFFGKPFCKYMCTDRYGHFKRSFTKHGDTL